MTKFGNWRARADKESAIVITDDGDMAADFTCSGRNHKQDVANATLAAAAPDLYAALDELVKAYNKTLRGDVFDLWDAAKSALAKARGES